MVDRLCLSNECLLPSMPIYQSYTDYGNHKYNETHHCYWHYDSCNIHNDKAGILHNKSIDYHKSKIK